MNAAAFSLHLVDISPLKKSLNDIFSFTALAIRHNLIRFNPNLHCAICAFSRLALDFDR